MTNAVLIDAADCVATLTGPVRSGERVFYEVDGRGAELTALQDIPAYHKIAVTDIPRGGEVRKYGQYIGCALCDIKKGDYVHTHNLR